MKKNAKIILAAALIAIAALAVWMLFPKSVSGSAELHVTILFANNTPAQNLEVDVGDKPGPPLEGGFIFTNENGTAVFFLKPGVYAIYFNQGNFPVDMQTPQLERIKVTEDKIAEKTIVLKAK